MEKLAINGGEPVRTKPFPSWPVVGEEERNNLLEVFESKKWWYGERVKEFEEKFADFQDTQYGITCTNGTAALEVSLLSVGIGPGDEVIVPPYTFVATASAVLRVNAIPIFADISLETANLDPIDAEKKITEKTKAVIPVHFAGLPVDMDAFNNLAKKHNLKIIEDACHSWGSKWKNRGTGALGDCGAFSFQMSKNITSGEGGIILTDNQEIADNARSYINCGRGKDKPWYEHCLLGSNLRLTELQAAILLGQLTRLESQVLKREENAKYLNERLKGMLGIKIIDSDDSRITRRSYHLYQFRYLKEEWREVSREKFLDALQAEGIPASSGYPHPLYKNPLFLRKGKGPRFCPLSCPYYGKEMDYNQVSCPNTEKICKEAVWFSQSVLLGDREDMDDIISAVKKIRDNISVII
ncbi:MAG: aminotransferase DegT [bacterium (Candidatus Ratteibacteria) CG_4_10_14_3_um_filter_41_18]|uniref:Aminotransferase DegT n=4 Tax=Candidatus Ratteibacteria TaxID=2979319 RepID=A0A2M7E8M2_9BACT|nr:MAG: aminotransferase DegT [bacterium (Candidatus Ratteibacteria) CG01_land_8_20_14_3_00_40_19]PIW33152.1 MAG: aminotransferase DegT [bacterium (Candidatus Ratteibacteria) CG15_BIG_FIL_POST_REV_8_21_14_020_41_12]PIX77110.1 MAG: aminotransferase DegT [bacterium (Candidatus Ratteibacteria) CG_4_10_14_3_um_filter_41_18]PJA61171.1 MAG: aminotransferase DegT [bacterium (Candidatus Ratteibacteria) CG_4_9_14_3_um_filter_41_21]HCG76997.1 aminotransferase DegT [bacterium]